MITYTPKSNLFSLQGRTSENGFYYAYKITKEKGIEASCVTRFSNGQEGFITQHFTDKNGIDNEVKEVLRTKLMEKYASIEDNG